MGWCINFKKAIEEGTIKLIDSYMHHKSWQDWTQEKVSIQKGFYIIDQYMDGEMSCTDFPAKPMIPLKYCPYCGATLTNEDI